MRAWRTNGLEIRRYPLKKDKGSISAFHMVYNLENICLNLSFINYMALFISRTIFSNRRDAFLDKLGYYLVDKDKPLLNNFPLLIQEDSRGFRKVWYLCIEL